MNSSRFAIAATIAALNATVAHACPKPPAPVVMLTGTPYYVDSRRSVVDENARALNEAQMRPVTDFVRLIADLSDDALKGDRRAGQCAMSAIVEWADADAMTAAPASRQGETQRILDLGGIALSLVKARGSATPRQEAEASQWVRRLAEATSDAFKDPRRKRNNLHAWWSFGQMAAGAATRDATIWSRGRAGLRQSLSQVQANGSLPLEAARGEKAMAYHDYALQPLAAASALASWANEPLDDAERDALTRLARHVSSASAQGPNQAWRPYVEGFSTGPRHFSARLGGDTALMAKKPPRIGR